MSHNQPRISLEYSRICKEVIQKSPYEFVFTEIIASFKPRQYPFTLTYKLVNCWRLDHKTHLERVSLHVPTSATYQDFDLLTEEIPNKEQLGAERYISTLPLDNLIFKTDCLLVFRTFLDGELVISLQLPVVLLPLGN